MMRSVEMSSRSRYRKNNGVYRIAHLVHRHAGRTCTELWEYGAVCLHPFFSTDAHEVRLYMGSLVRRNVDTFVPICERWITTDYFIANHSKQKETTC